MPVSTSVDGIRPVEFNVHVDDYRSHRIPGLPKAKIGSCYIRGTELVAHLDLDDWLEVNPRVPNRGSKEVLTGHVVKGIRETMQDAPADFAIKNQGLFLLVESVVDYDRQRDGGRLKLRLTDPGQHGLCNGGHSYAAIREYAENAEDPTTLEEVWVRLHIFEGIEAEKVPVMAEGLNRSKQVDDPSLMDLAGKFAQIQDALQGKSGSDQIAYHQGGAGDYYVTDIIRAIMFFNCERYTDRQHPSSLYRQQKQMIRLFTADSKANPSPIDLIVPRVHEILVLMDRIAKLTPEAAKQQRQPFLMGRMLASKRKNGPRAASAQHRDTPLYFLNDTMDLKVPNGWLMVMLAAFRANVRWNLASGLFEWKVPLEDLIPKVIDDLVRVCVQEYRENKVKPDEMARNASIYEQCYNKVELHLLKAH